MKPLFFFASQLYQLIFYVNIQLLSTCLNFCDKKRFPDNVFFSQVCNLVQISSCFYFPSVIIHRLSYRRLRSTPGEPQLVNTLLRFVEQTLMLPSGIIQSKTGLEAAWFSNSSMKTRCRRRRRGLPVRAARATLNLVHIWTTHRSALDDNEEPAASASESSKTRSTKNSRK